MGLVGNTLKYTVKNPNLYKALALGIAEGMADAAATSVYMHRGLTHRSLELKEPAKTIARTILWTGTGVKPRRWAAVHRKHHKLADTVVAIPGNNPGEYIIQKDPHSPADKGRFGVPKNAATNVRNYKAEEQMVDEAALPPDLQPDRADKLLYDKSKLGLGLSLIGHAGAMHVATGNPLWGGVSWLAAKQSYKWAGDGVNSLGHAGRNPLRAIVSGFIKPFEDGTIYSDSRWVALVSAGEGNQRWHHLFPNRKNFSDPEKTVRQQHLQDMGGAVCDLLIAANLAVEGPGVEGLESPSKNGGRPFGIPDDAIVVESPYYTVHPEARPEIPEDLQRALDVDYSALIAR